MVGLLSKVILLFKNRYVKLLYSLAVVFLNVLKEPATTHVTLLTCKAWSRTYSYLNTKLNDMI